MKGRRRRFGGAAIGLISAAGSSGANVACWKSWTRRSLATLPPSGVGSAQALRWSSLALVEELSADCPAAGGKPVLEEGVVVVCKKQREYKIR